MSKELIYALSSLGTVTLDRFNELFNKLYLPGDGEEDEINHRRQVCRALDSLGFLEFDFNARRVFMCPPALVLLPSCGLPRALLTGARTPSLIARLKNNAFKKSDLIKLYKYSQKKKWLNLPDVIILESVDTDLLKEVANESGISFSLEAPAAWKILTLSASIKDTEAELSFTDRSEINWKMRVFDIERLSFSYSSNVKLDEPSLIEYTHPLTQQKVHWIRNGKAVSETGRDWGRYIILKNHGKNVIMYDESKGFMAVPLTVPLPKIIARAVTLCSGRAPLIHKINSITPAVQKNPALFCIYKEVPECIAEIIAQKTGQEVVQCKIDLKKAQE